MGLTLAVHPVGAPARRRTSPLLDPAFLVAASTAVLLGAGIGGPVTASLLATATILFPGVLVAASMRPTDALERIVTVVAASLVGWMLVAHVMLTFRWWYPDLVAAAALGVFALARLVQVGRGPAISMEPIRPMVPQVVAGTVAVGLWLWSLTRLDVTDIGLLGLATELPVVWFVALGLAVIAAAVAATAPHTSPGRVVAGVVPLLVILYGTIAATTGTIRYPWSYKHVGVVRLLDETGRLHPDVDIYNNFSGFFGLVALNRGATNVDPTSYAAWAQMVGEGFVLLAVGYLVHRATASVRVAQLAVVIYLLTNWVGQNYFAAQTLGSFMALVALGMICSWFRRDRGRPPDTAEPPVGRPADPALQTRRCALLALVFLGALMVHPLTPIVVIGAVVVAVTMGWVRDRWLLVALAAVAVAWVVRAFPYFAAQEFDLGFGGSPTDNAAGNVDTVNAPADALLIGNVTKAYSAGVWLLAAVGGVVAAWAKRRIGLLVVLAMIPFGIPLVQSYGGEAIYRVYLYSLPVMAALIAWGIVSTTPIVRRPRLPQPTVLAAVVCLCLAAGFVVVHYGRERVNQVDRSEVAMEEYVDETVDGPAILAQFSGSHPAQSTARYPEFQVTDTYTPQIAEMLGPTEVLPPTAALDEVADDLVELTAGTPYVIVGPGMVDELAVVGSFPVSTTGEAAAFLLSHPRFRLAHRIDDTYLIAVAR